MQILALAQYVSAVQIGEGEEISERQKAADAVGICVLVYRRYFTLPMMRLKIEALGNEDSLPHLARK
jgi:hypothetical protein